MSCHKVAYPSRADAVQSAKKLKNVNGRQHKPYLCKYCKTYHLSTMTAKQVRQLKKLNRKATSQDEVERDLITEFTILKRSKMI